MTWTIPNVLTTLRLLAAPGVVMMFLYFTRPWADWFALVLFVGAAVTDWFDGYLARLWKQESKFGTMLDPIADKAMVVIALLVITGFSGMNPWILLPATLILFREVFVSGLREFLGAAAGRSRSRSSPSGRRRRRWWRSRCCSSGRGSTSSTRPGPRGGRPRAVERRAGRAGRRWWGSAFCGSRRS
jgi:CDP-diacylglycerol--glycerol-3-phosphate 3-phosphatidyltransferase